MRIQAVFCVPHPPVMVPRVGRGQESDIHSTIEALRNLSRRLARLRPDTIVISSPHAPAFSDHLFINDSPHMIGDLSVFGDRETRIAMDNDLEFAGALQRMATEAGLSAGPISEKVLSRHGLHQGLDHGVVAPLFWLLSEWPGTVPLPRLVHLSTPPFDPVELYRIGRCIAETAEQLGRHVVCIASGDLSHRLKLNGPYGLDPEGPVFDRQLVSDVAASRLPEIYAYDARRVSHAGECGLCSIRMMIGALDGCSVAADMLSYEGPFGVGYMVAALTPEGSAPSIMPAILERLQDRRSSVHSGDDAHVGLARAIVEGFTETGRIPSLPEGLPEDLLDARAGVFVSLHRHGALRGCIGTTAPTTGSVAEEIRQNAVSACSQDPRFSPLQPTELADLEVSVDVLMPPESIPDASLLDVKRYGVIVSCGGRRGLLLPDLDGVDTVEDQIAIACRKGGISPGEPYSLQRFEVKRHGG